MVGSFKLPYGLSKKSILISKAHFIAGLPRTYLSNIVSTSSVIAGHSRRMSRIERRGLVSATSPLSADKIVILRTDVRLETVRLITAIYLPRPRGFGGLPAYCSILSSGAFHPASQPSFIQGFPSRRSLPSLIKAVSLSMFSSMSPPAISRKDFSSPGLLACCSVPS